MKNNILTIIKKEFARFFGDKRMVFTTILMPGLLIYFMYTLMGQGMMKSLGTDDEYVARAYVENMPAELNAVFHEITSDWTEISESEKASVQEKLENKEADVLVVFPKDFSAQIAAYDTSLLTPAPEVKIYYNSTASESEKCYTMLREILNQYEASMANKFDINVSEEDFNCASEKDITGMIFSMMLPMLLMIFMFSGCMSIAPEAIAGEKERGTIATLLVTPMKRSALALGKIISLSAIALLAGVSSFLGTMLSMPNLMGGETGMDASVYGATEYVLLLFVILTTILLMVAMLSVISALAKSVKEAGTLISPLMILVMGISLLPMFSGNSGSTTKNIATFLIPIYNSVQCFQGIFSFHYEVMQVAVTLGSNIVYAGLLTFILTKLFNNENIMFGK